MDNLKAYINIIVNILEFPLLRNKSCLTNFVYVQFLYEDIYT
jgi:hypothetical protein